MELPTSLPLFKRALKGVDGRTSPQGLQKECAARLLGTHSWDDRVWLRCGARVDDLFGCLWRWAIFFVARSDEIFASATGVVHPVHCLTRKDVALYRGGQRLISLQRHQATSIEVRFRGHKGDQAKQGSVMVRTRDDARGALSEVGEGGEAVALVVELLSSYSALPKSTSLSSYRFGNEVRVWSYTGAFAALRQVVANAGDDLSEVGLQSLRIGVATTLAAGGKVWQTVIQREGRWKSSESSKMYTRNNTEDAGIISRKLAETGKLGRQPGQGTVWGRAP